MATLDPDPLAFVLLEGDQQVSPPYAFKKVGIRAFPLEARYDRVKALVDRFLNDGAPAGVEYRPLDLAFTKETTMVYVEVLDYGSMVSQSPPYDQWGYFTQKELYFILPVVRWRNGVKEDVKLFAPFIFVDNPWSMLSGNMVIGYPKGMAWFQLPQDPAHPYPTRVATQVFPRFSPSTRLSWEPFLLFESASEPPPWEPPSAVNPRELWPFGYLEGLFGPGGFAEVEEQTWLLLQGVMNRGACGIVQRKQVRDEVHHTQACFASIVSFARQLTGLRGGGLLEAATIDLIPYASLPIAAVLGLGEGPLEPILPYWIDCDFDFVHPAAEYTVDVPTTGAPRQVAAASRGRKPRKGRQGRQGQKRK